MRGLIAWSVVALTLLSLAWTTWKVRRILRQSLGRKLRSGEETSLRTWMELPDTTLASATRELNRDPFERVLKVLEAVGLFRRNLGARGDDPASAGSATRRSLSDRE